MLVQTDLLTKSYGPFTALDNCSLSIQAGEVFGLLGPNGAGKTTFLRLLMGFLRPSSGTAKIDALDCYHESVEVHRRVAYLPGDARLFRRMRGRDVLEFFANVRPGGDLAKSRQLAARLDLDLSRRVGLMSTGMRQKVALAATLANSCKLLILDEPTANLDPNVRSEIGRMVDEARNDGRTVLFSSHVLPEVEELCDRVAILRRGKLVHTQSMSQLRRCHRIHAQLQSKLPAIPETLQQHVTVTKESADSAMLETTGELSPLLGWLSEIKLSEVHIEPVGLRAIYDRFHSEPSN